MDSQRGVLNTVSEPINSLRAVLERERLHTADTRTRRLAALELLEMALATDDADAWALEEVVRCLLDRNQGLWLIDERLGSHVPFRIDSKQQESGRLGIGDSVFDVPHAFRNAGSPCQSVVILEFKRPQAEEHLREEQDVVEQVLGCVREIKDSLAKEGYAHSGSAQFFARILCSMTPRIRELAEVHDFSRTPDKGGYFKYHQTEGCHIEMVSYEKLLADARRTNHAAFESAVG